VSLTVSLELLALEDFLRGPGTIQTHLLAWRVSDFSAELYNVFAADADTIMSELADEAEYLEAAAPSAVTFQELFPEAFLSYTRDVDSPEDVLPPHVRLFVAFKGEPRPWVVDPAWAWVPWRTPPELVESDPYDVDIIPTDYHLEDALLDLVEATDIFVTPDLLTDDFALTLDETAAMAAVFTGVDTSGLSLTQAANMAVTLNAADAVATAVAEASALSGFLTRTDETSLAGDDSVALAAAVASVDESSVPLDEATAILVAQATTDAPALGIAASVNLLALAAASDTPSVELVQVADRFVLLAPIDLIAATLGETATLRVIVATGETLPLVVDGVTAINATLTRSDSAAISIADARSINATLARADNAALAVSAVAMTEVELGGGDNVDLGSVDATTNLTATVLTTDDLPIAGEDLSNREIIE